MESENYVAAVERLLRSRLELVVRHRPIIRVLCDAMSEAGFALELIVEIKTIADEKLMEITAQYANDRKLVDMTNVGPPWQTKSIDDGLALVDDRLNECVVLCQNCVLYNRFFDGEMLSLDADYKRHVRTNQSIAQRVQEFAVHYVLLEQQYLENAIRRAIKRDKRPTTAVKQPDEVAEPTTEEAEPVVDEDAPVDAAAAQASTKCSSMVEQVFLLLRKSCVRALSMYNGTAVSMLLHHVTAELLAREGDYRKEMDKRWRRCNDDLEDMILCLNNMATSGLYTSKLKDEIMNEAERLEQGEREQIQHLIGELENLSDSWVQEVRLRVLGADGPGPPGAVTRPSRSP